MIKLGLERISGLLVQLSKPTWVAIHIAGTNGKGSVASYLSSLFLRSSKPHTGELRIGKFTSPHLIDRWDCITINDQPVSESLFLAVEDHVKSVALKLESRLVSDGRADDETKVSQFELLTATAFEIFSQQKCQLAVVECGLGGRLDATNAIRSQNVAVSVITKIGLDHQSFLGTTMPEIAIEKAGIIRHSVPVVVDGTNTPGVKLAIARVASEKQAELSETTEHGIGIEIEKDTSLPLHERQNLQVALLAFSKAIARITTLDVQSITFTNDKSSSSSLLTSTIIKQILSDVSNSYPGRLQSISIQPIIPEYKPQILLDGAHNAQSATVLREHVELLLTLQSHNQSQSQPQAEQQSESSHKTHPGIALHQNEKGSKKYEEEKEKNVSWIVAMSQGKNAHEILNILLQSRKQDRVICCGFGIVDGMPWVKSMDPSSLSDIAKPIVGDANVVICEDIIDALTCACSSTSFLSSSDDDDDHHHDDSEMKSHIDEGNQIVVAGSLYLVSDLLRSLRSAKLRKDVKSG